MRIPRIRFTSRGMMLLILVVALATTVVVQQIQLREAAAREQKLHSALFGGIRPAQIKVVERNVAVEVPFVKDQWPVEIKRVTPPPADR